MESEVSFAVLSSAVAASEVFVPSYDSVVKPEILAEVFPNEPIPFQLNPDGSVNRKKYIQWLNVLGQQALFDMECMSETIVPKTNRARTESR